ncbi:MAG: DUF2934 domain-containing protein [Archangium sp.]
MTTKPRAEKSAKTKRAVAAKAKLTTGAKRAVKRVRVQMVKPTPSAPTHTVVTRDEMSALETVAVVETKQVVTIERAELELMIRREAFKRAQARQFRGGSPANDWFAAEAAVKAELSSRGVQLPN